MSALPQVSRPKPPPGQVRMHTAQSGKSAGRLVPCTAQFKCTLVNSDDAFYTPAEAAAINLERDKEMYGEQAFKTISKGTSPKKLSLDSLDPNSLQTVTAKDVWAVEVAREEERLGRKLEPSDKKALSMRIKEGVDKHNSTVAELKAAKGIVDPPKVDTPKVTLPKPQVVNRTLLRPRKRLGTVAEGPKVEADNTGFTGPKMPFTPAVEPRLEEHPIYQKQSAKAAELGSAEKVSKYVPRRDNLEAYYAATDKKHFQDPNRPGSQFTDNNVKTVNELVALAGIQRNGLHGDDREIMIRDYGAQPEAFSSKFRYLLVETPGLLGAAPLYTFPDDTVFEAKRTKEGGAVTIMAYVDEKPTTDVAVLIMSDKVKTKSGEKIGTAAVTAHPGMPVRLRSSDSNGTGTFEAYEGQKLTKAQIMEIAGDHRVNVNTAIRKKG